MIEDKRESVLAGRPDRAWQWREGDTTVTRSICWSAPGCHGGCGVLLQAHEGRLLKVVGDRENPFNRGRLCPRGLALADTLYHPDRLRVPLLRTGKRGSGRFKEISWDEALDFAAGKMLDIGARYGREAMLFAQGTGRDILTYLIKMSSGFGSPNNAAFGPGSGNACYQPRLANVPAMAGSFMAVDCGQAHPERHLAAEHRDPDLILLWGSNPVYSNPDGFLGHWITDCMKRGTRLITVDPRMTWLASKSEQWLSLRPGTDGMLALAMLHVIIKEGLFDREFVDKWVHGFAELAEKVADYGPDVAAGVTGVAAADIEQAARAFARAKPGAIHWGVATDQHKECFGTHQALLALWTITGNVEIPGGMVAAPFCFGLPTVFFGRRDLPRGLAERKVGDERYPMFRHFHRDAQGDSVIRAIETGQPYPIRGAWFWSTNTAVASFADPARVSRAFLSLDFVGVVDLFMTPTALAFADLVLPATTYAEKDSIRSWSYQLAAMNQGVDRVGESLPDAEIIRRLGILTRPENFQYRHLHDLLDDVLAPIGVTFEELRRKGPLYPPMEYGRHEKGGLRGDHKPGFRTPTGKIELYSTIFEHFGLDPLPHYEEPPESPVSTPALCRDYPFVLTTGARVPVMFCSEHRNVPRLRRHNPLPLLEINSKDASRLGIARGNEIKVASAHGSCRFSAQLSEGIKPGVVHAQFGWWFPEKEAVPEGDEVLGGVSNHFGMWDSNVNRLLPSGWQGRSGFGYPFKSQVCRIERVGPGMELGPGTEAGIAEPLAEPAASVELKDVDEEAAALLVDREWCFGCKACVLACQQEHSFPSAVDGIRVLQSGPRLEEGKPVLEFDPVPTANCDLCRDLLNHGDKPACVIHCQGGCLREATVRELAGLARRRPGSVLYLAGGQRVGV